MVTFRILRCNNTTNKYLFNFLTQLESDIRNDNSQLTIVLFTYFVTDAKARPLMIFSTVLIFRLGIQVRPKIKTIENIITARTVVDQLTS